MVSKRIGVAAAVLVALGLLALSGAACGDDDGVPAPHTVDVLAPIDELELIIRESFPPQYAARVVSGLPDGCESFKSIEMDRAGNEFNITVTNERTTGEDVACTQIYGTHEEVVELGSDLEPDETYVVRANDRELTFTAQ